MHAGVARSTFRSQNVQNTRGSDHFWRFRCRKSARRCGTKHIPSQNVQNTRGSDHFWRCRCGKSARRCGAKHISKPKCLKKNRGFGPLLEVQMSLRFTTLRYTTWYYTTLHSTTLHYITLHSTTLQLHNYTPLNYTTLHYLPLHFTTLHYTTLHYNYNYHYTTTTTTTTTTSSTAQGGGGSFKNRKPIGRLGCCESGMAERSHWWTERWLISFTLSLFLNFSLCFSIILWLSTDLPL